jgi:predicted HicB family RNase H-like nuclease
MDRGQVMVEKSKKGTEIERVRSKNLVIRLLDQERAELMAVAEYEQLSASAWVRRAVREAFRRYYPDGLPKKPKKGAK